MAAQTSKSSNNVCAHARCAENSGAKKYCTKPQRKSTSNPAGLSHRALSRARMKAIFAESAAKRAAKATQAPVQVRTAPKAQRVSGKQVAGSKYLAQAAAQVKAGNLSVEGYAALASVLAA